MTVNDTTKHHKPMAQSDHETNPETTNHSPPPPTTASPWGTWEELLLAYAVNRHGTKSWDSISSELRKRTSDPTHLSPHHCEQKYAELKRRFHQSDDVVLDEVTDSVPWLEELRNQRVVELQRELQNYDLYISSLQLKVKKLTEESEKPSKPHETTDLDHQNNVVELVKEDETIHQTHTPTPEPLVSGEEEEYSDRDNQSVNGSNGNVETGVEKSEPVEEKGEPEGIEPDGVEPVRLKAEPDRTESMAESKSEGKNSDVQSSASKSRKERSDRVRRGCREEGGREEIEDLSTDSVPVRSLPLVEFLQKVQKVGSALFEPRLDRQEKLRYKNLIRQPIDYETLQTRLKEGWYSDGNDKFFRDLLLLVNNTRIFFPKESVESIAAIDLRQLILKELLSKKKQRTDSKSTDKQTSSKSSNPPPKQATEVNDSLLLKPKLTGPGPIVVCRKRSSITAKKEQTDSKNLDKVTEETPKKSRDSFPKKKGKSPVNESGDHKPEKKKKLTEAEEKKQSAAKFLNRMKRSNELSPLKSPLDRGGFENDTKGGDQKKSGGSKGYGKKDGKKSSGGRQFKEQDSPGKRSVGRPPKRGVVLGKRNREPVVDSEMVDLKQTKKRSKR